MDLFKYTPPTSTTATDLQQGEPITDIDSVTWTERYSSPGEFTLESKLSSGHKNSLSPGTLLSHVDTTEVMMVENQEIKEQDDEDPKITISGRSLIAYLDYRVAGMRFIRASSTPSDYTLAANTVSLQAAALLQEAIQSLLNPNDLLANINVYAEGSWGASAARTIAPGAVLPELLKLLAIEDLGVRTIRKNPFGIGAGGTDIQTVISIYKGSDVSDKVIYSKSGGHLESVDYLFSNKMAATSCVVRGRYVQAVLETGTGYEMRQVMIDGSDIDGYLDAAPTGGTLTTIIGLMQERALQHLTQRTDVSIARADVSKNDPYRYRHDYNVGDIVMVEANYGATEKFRVVEYVEIEDENGESGHPTFSIPSSP